MKNILLTGATGFVGRNLLVRAARQESRILAPVRDPSKLAAQLAAEGIPHETVTPLPADPGTWSPISPDLAVLSAGILFARNRAEYFATNVDWTLRVLAALPPDCRTIVLSSQSAGGPTPSRVAARTEETPDAPITWYGESKLQLERLIRERFPDRPITILRPPMILGARDSATLPLFRMAAGWLRPKPGLRAKSYSFLAVDDVVDAIFAAAVLDQPGPFYIAAEKPVTDLELIATAAGVMSASGITLPVPQPFIRLLAGFIDRVPALREKTPSLTRDRAREIWPDRWVVDPSAFSRATGWRARLALATALHDACRHYRDTGQL